ncbi:MAG: UPF0158 family protein [Treponema sp.]|nr:UPF0158 family protein [Spirochaetia bacterium]MDD7451943.1 UPF0158 family protein [Treponema sp.]MDY5682179.1 UPF0158 family protein [Treponema sp.]
MYFDLTESIKDSILNAMDDQTSDLVFDSKSRSVVESDQNTTNNEQYIDLPKWTSADGFKIRQDFVSCLHAPLAKDELQQILHSGRGVFRNFKSCLKQYPEIEKKWHLFKRRKMLLKVNEWYNALRELWGLEALEAEPEDFEDLVQNDFIFRGYDSAKDKESVLHYANVEEVCIDENLEEVSAAIKFLWERQFLSQDSDFGLVSKTFSDDFAGCITFQACTSSSTKAVVLSAFFVLKNFRGLGIGRMLLSQSLELLRKRKIQWVIIANVIIPDSMIPLLNRSGFKKIGSGYIARLF